MSVLVVGSFITDFIARCSVAPRAGETTIGKAFNTYPGGKGANQAVACHNMGSTTYMAGSVGDDLFGKNFIDIFKQFGFDTKYIIKTNEASTGASLVTVEESGQNRIVMTPGANLKYSTKDLDDIEYLFDEISTCVTQNEQSIEIVNHLSEMCKKHNVKMIYNPAPAREIKKEVLDGLFLITPNETELGLIVGRTLVTDNDYKEAAKELLGKGVLNVVVTLGDRGCLYVSKDEEVLIPSFKVKAIDTVGAGDCFSGTLAACIDQGLSIKESLRVANAASALEVQKNGAIPAIPKREDVFKFLDERK